MEILIIGIVASGKTVFANQLSSKHNINHYEIDSIVHDDIKKIKRMNNITETINDCTAK